MDEGQHELRRSHKVDFTGGSSGITRERSFIRPQSQYHHQGQHNNNKRRSQIIMQPKSKPTLELYRPPNVRTEGQPADQINPKLNVHAKEFTMRQQQQQQHLADIQTSRSSINVPRDAGLINLQHSRSSGNILRHPLTAISLQSPHIQPPQNQNHHLHAPHHHFPIPLLQSASSGNILHPSPRVHFQIHAPTITFPNVQQNQSYRHHNHKNNQSQHGNHNHSHGGIKRSKSMSAADSASFAAKLKELTLQADAPDLGEFPPDIQSNIQIACEDPNKLPGRTIMELVKLIMERIVEGRKYSIPGAKLCASIIEKERTETFLESLMNICQQWYQERDRILRNVRAADGSRFTAFMWFLTEMSCQLKRLRLQKLDCADREPPHLVLLALLVRCCQVCVKPPIRSLAEIECLFFVLTSIGRDLEQELPAQLDLLLTSLRDGFLASAALPAVRKTLLQLIELKASNWQLSGPTVLYYYPKMK